MPITSEVYKDRYVGNGSASVYAYNYRITAASQLEVTEADGDIDTDPSVVETTLILDTDYTVSDVGEDTGSITLLNGNLADGHVLAIERKPLLVQETDFENQGGFFPENHTDVADNLMMGIQRVMGEVARAPKIPKTSALTGDDYLDIIQAAVTDSEAAQAAAEAAEATATTQAGIATTQAGLAATARTAAETAQGLAETAEDGAVAAQGLAESARDLAQTYANGLKATSVTSNAIGTGAKTFTTQTGKQFIAGQFVVIVDAADAANYMVCSVTSYSSSTLVVNSLTTGGSGTKTAWNIAIAGSVGPTGAAGTAGLNFLSGAGAPSDSLGVQNDMYLNTTNWDVYKKGASTWGSSIGNIKGATGDTGATGAQGPSGDGKFNTATTTVKTDNYTVQATDFGNVLVMNASSGKTFTLPDITTASVITLKNIGTADTTITKDASDTLELTTLKQYESVVLIADTVNNVWRAVAKFSSVAAASATELSFVNGDLSAGVLTVTHNKALAAGYTALVTVVNNSGAVVIPDAINTFATNSFKIDLSSYGTLTGTWYCIYITK